MGQSLKIEALPYDKAGANLKQSFSWTKKSQKNNLNYLTFV